MTVRTRWGVAIGLFGFALIAVSCAPAPLAPPVGQIAQAPSQIAQAATAAPTATTAATAPPSTLPAVAPTTATTPSASTAANPWDTVITQNDAKLLQDGRNVFRFDTFGDETFWGDTLQLHKAIEGAKNGGVGDGVSPKTALSVGLKVDMDVLPANLVAQIKAGQVNLDDPATTLALLKLNAVVGVKGNFTPDGSQLQSIGITCAFCHSTVDDAFAAGIGHRLDGYPNRDLNVGAIVSLSPGKKALADALGVDVPTVDKVLASWGPGKFDAELFLDGKAFRPDGKTAATLIPAAFGLAGVNLHTWTGDWGNVTYWNAFVANLEMHGQGTFYDPRLDDPNKYPVAARLKLGHKADPTDMTSPGLPSLQFYQLSIPSPKAPAGTFDQAAAGRGQAIFMGKAKCGTCHVPPTYTEPGWNLHTAQEIGIDDFQASRAPNDAYRTSPLRALWDTNKTHKGGFYHDGRFATLQDVINHYNTTFKLNLTDPEIKDLIEFLKTL
jgi:hypothetical protein